MDPTAHGSNEEDPSTSPDPTTSIRYIIKSKESNSRLENNPSKENFSIPPKTNENSVRSDEQVLRIENLSSPESDRVNEYVFMPSSSGSDDEIKKISGFENSEMKEIPTSQNKVHFNGEPQLVQYYSAKEDKNKVRFVELFDEKQYEDDDSDVPSKRRKLCFGYDELDPDSKSYKLFTDMHKLKIMQVIEECFTRLADDGVLDTVLGMTVNRRMHRIRELYEYHLRSFSCRRFVLPWIMVKIIEIILCNIMLFTFISEGTYFTKRQEYLPVAVIFYLTLFLILATLLSYISCYTYSLVYNPFYMWSVIASAILSLMTTSSIFVMLCASGYTSSHLQVTVLFLSAALISCIIGELFLCYFELKKSMNQIGHSEI